MKKQLLLILFLKIFTLNCYAQISFEKGYYINNSDEEIECFIKNSDWRNNPTEFNYKISENTEVKTVSIKTVKEFEIYDASRYVRKTVQIDMSKDIINNVSFNRNPEYKEQQFFFKSIS